MLTATRYHSDMECSWNDLVRKSANGTFLMDRGFMDYHAQRFTDCSLCFTDNGKMVAALPANISNNVVTCHGGLTYGPLIVLPQATQAQIHACFLQAISYYKNIGAQRLIYKPIPYIYINGCHDEDLYEMFRLGAKLKARALSTCVDLHCPLKMRELRQRCIRKAIVAGLTLCQEDCIEEFWTLLDDVLTERHKVHPVHTATEMRLLSQRFKQSIKLYTVRNAERELIAGVWVFFTSLVAHIQYIAANSEGRAKGALDLLFANLIQKEITNQKWMDFGISTEEEGRVLNEGLLWQKESFGGRGVCYDQYEIVI